LQTPNIYRILYLKKKTNPESPVDLRTRWAPHVPWASC